MNTKSQWILQKAEIQEFQKQKRQHYHHFQYEVGRDDIFTSGYLQKFISYTRKRKKANELLFKNQRVVFYAVSLFKRYYLVNSFICEDMTYTQAMVCSFYLSLKYNQYNDQHITKLANKWKHKPLFSSKDHLPHFGDDGYSAAELKFLSGIRFQTGISKVITPIESMFHAVNKGQSTSQDPTIFSETNEDKYGLCPLIEKYLSRLYAHKNLMFLFEGPKIALGMMVAILKQKKLNINLLGKSLEGVCSQNHGQIEAIIQMLLQVKDEKNGYEVELKRINSIQSFKKPLKMSQSPAFKPKTHDHLFDPQ